MKYSINTWVEAPKGCDLLNAIRKYCIDEKITIHKLESVSVNKDILDKLFFIDREVIYFHIEGEKNSILNIKKQLEDMSKD